MKRLDLITIGRSSVDLYGDQIGGRLEDMGSFSKYIGGSPTNIACGTARLGLKSAVITGVGDEHMGRFIREQLAREGVDTRGVKVDPDRLTALVLLGIRDDERFPLIFYRENCADMGLTEDDIDEGFIAEARAVLATGTHLSHPRTEAAVLEALKPPAERGARTALDIDYRANLGASRVTARSGAASSRGHGCDEEAADRSPALVRPDRRHRGGVPRRQRRHGRRRGASGRAGVSDATLVCRSVARRGRITFEGAVTDSLDDGRERTRLCDRVLQRLGADNDFFSGLLEGSARGRRTGRDGAWDRRRLRCLAVSRHGCAPAYPRWQSCEFFFERGIIRPDLRHERELEEVHSEKPASGRRPRCGCSHSTTGRGSRKCKRRPRTRSAPSRHCASRRR